MKSYLITDPKYYSNSKAQFQKILSLTYQKIIPDFACFRDKESENYEELAKIFLETSREFKIKKVLINSYIELANKLNFDGIHLASTQFNQINLAKSLNLYTICSTHSLNEIKFCEKNQVDAITFSPIFDTPNKGEPKGLQELNKILNQTNIKIFALGGIISKKHLKELEKTKVYGFASIRYFLD